MKEGGGADAGKKSHMGKEGMEGGGGKERMKSWLCGRITSHSLFSWLMGSQPIVQLGRRVGIGRDGERDEWIWAWRGALGRPGNIGCS